LPFRIIRGQRDEDADAPHTLRQRVRQRAITRLCSQGPRRNLQFINYVGRTFHHDSSYG
jgi:hypothetical protein